MVDAFLNLLDKVTLEAIESQEALKVELDKFRRLSSAVMGYNDSPDQPEVNLHNFAKYILIEGKRDEKRALISCLKQTIFLKNKELSTQV